MKDSKIYDCLLIGGGPASLSASIYLARANYKIGFIEKGAPGGKVVKTGDIENYLGYKRIDGPSLATNFFSHALELGAEYIGEEVLEISKNKEGLFEVITNDSNHLAKSVVIASGTLERKLNVKGEEEFENRGVSGCAICDAPIFKNEVMTFVGGGNAAIGEALHVMNFAKHIHLVHRRDFFRANKPLVDKLLNSEKVTSHLFWVVKEIKGDESVKSIIIENTKTNEAKEIKTSVVFPYIGAYPNVSFLKTPTFKAILDKENYIKTDSKLTTSVKGLFAAGVVIEKDMRQIASAVGDGAIVSRSVVSYLEE